MTKPNIVIIGGGNGSSVTINALKREVKNFNLKAIVSMSDSGGSTGKLRKELNILPPSDIMRATLAFSPYDYRKVLRPMFYKTRFTDAGKMTGHNLGNMFMALATLYAGDFLLALKALHQAVAAVGEAIPVTTELTDLCAELTDGTIVKTEAKLDKPEYDRSLKIKRVWLEPKAKINPAAAEAIQRADVIILSPGSLYTSVIATLLPDGVVEAIKKSRAKLIYVAGNAFHQNGETGPENFSGIISALEHYLPRPLDYILYNNSKLNANQKKRYREKFWGVFEHDLSQITQPHRLIGADFESPLGGLNSDRLSPHLIKIIKQL